MNKLFIICLYQIFKYDFLVLYIIKKLKDLNILGYEKKEDINICLYKYIVLEVVIQLKND